MNPALLLQEVAAERPDACAVVFGARRLTYSQLLDRASRLAAAFAELGLGPDSRVAVLLPNCDDWPVVYHACAWSGTVIAPVDLRLQATEVEAILGDLEPHAIIARSDVSDEVAELVERNHPSAPRILVGSGRNGWLDFEALIRSTRPMPRPVLRSEEDLSAILYTSGSTGRPKGAMLPFRVWDAFQICLEDLYAPPPNRAWLIFAPMSHISG
ncbi:MAG: AMP-binding protein, partial [Armatimonadetes bacterium]|nr:AMP-binding protein [Armatimonadota bacterium]